jgi:hypothetical protein
MIKGNVKGGLEFYKRKVYEIDVADVTIDGSVLVYPNPAKDILAVSWSNVTGNEVSVAITDISGRVVQRHLMSSQLGHIQLSVAGLSAGLYICVVESAGSKYHAKFTILH